MGIKKRPDCSGRFLKGFLSALVLRLDRSGCGHCVGTACGLLGLNLLGKILDSLLKIDERHPSDEVAILSGGLIGEGGGIEKTGLASLGVPLDHGVNLLVSNSDLGRDTLEGGLLDCGCALFVAPSQYERGCCEKGVGE